MQLISKKKADTAAELFQLGPDPAILLESSILQDLGAELSIRVESGLIQRAIDLVRAEIRGSNSLLWPQITPKRPTALPWDHSSFAKNIFFGAVCGWGRRLGGRTTGFTPRLIRQTRKKPGQYNYVWRGYSRTTLESAEIKPSDGVALACGGLAGSKLFSFPLMLTDINM
eukprot:467778-Pelagomonas_calceolata.AAC.2